MITLTILGRPFGKQRHRSTSIGKFARQYTPKETVSYENLIKLCFTGKYPESVPMNFALSRRIIAYMPIPKSTSKKNRQLMLDEKIYPTKKPDDDNILKIVGDALNGVAYRDDALFVESMILKLYSDRPRVEIMIKEMR